MPTDASLATRIAASQTAASPRPARHGPGGAFWSHGVCLGDLQSQRIAHLPARNETPRPMVAQYLFMVRTLAAAWRGHNRPALMAACAGLMHYGNTYLEDAAPLGAALRADAVGTAVRMVDGLSRRLEVPIAGFATLHHDFGSYLAQMAAASADLETDTVLVTRRMQADQVHAFILGQHVHALQDKLDAASARRHGLRLLIPHADLSRKEMAAQGAALEGVRRQLDQLRADQGITLAEAAYLQGLLPTVAAYLGAVDRIGIGIHAAWTGIQGLQEQLGQLKQQLLAGSLDVERAHAELTASLPGWRDLASSLTRLDL